MRAVIQRVKKSSVTVDGELISEIGHGFNVLLGVEKNDTQEEADYLAGKIARLRVFEDENGKMNKSIIDVGGSILAVSQFTLLGNASKGNRPSFIEAEEPNRADALYEYFMQALTDNGVGDVKAGVFGADMTVEIIGDGPVTILMDTRTMRK